MRLLLDTHIALWAVTDSPKLSARARELIATPENAPFVSVATIWEIAIKHALPKRGAGRMPISGREALEYFQQAGYALLAVAPAHAIAVELLPRVHADPFDRLLVAQAREEPLRLLTHDARLGSYGPDVLVV
ncbi:MAG: type II toxin-antitoxin system VapC family toxin [Terricaulis sp.]